MVRITSPPKRRSASMPTAVPRSRQALIFSIESTWPRPITSCCAIGLMALSIWLTFFALPSYIAIATFRPATWRPSARITSKLPMCAPIRNRPRPSASKSFTMSSPVTSMSNRSKRLLSR